jgi:outer membrane lipoprotein SlyB
VVAVIHQRTLDAIAVAGGGGLLGGIVAAEVGGIRGLLLALGITFLGMAVAGWYAPDAEEVALAWRAEDDIGRADQ